MRSIRSHATGCVGLALATMIVMAGTAKADDQPFVTLYTTDVATAHERELEQWFGWSGGHAHESFNGFTSSSAFEYGITDDLQASLYLNYEWERLRTPPGPAETGDNAGLSGELIWRVMNVYFDPFGLAFYVEPGISAKERSFETKILLQKNFFNDKLRNALNVNFEDVWSKNAIGGWDKSSALEFRLGSAYNITPEFSLGLEFGNEREFDGLVLGGSPTAAANSYFLGPTVQYIGRFATVTFGAQAQLPWADNPSHVPGAVVDGYTADAEHFRMLLRFNKDL